jgi:hypothetical protein
VRHIYTWPMSSTSPSRLHDQATYRAPEEEGNRKLSLPFQRAPAGQLTLPPNLARLFHLSSLYLQPNTWKQTAPSHCRPWLALGCIPSKQESNLETFLPDSQSPRQHTNLFRSWSGVELSVSKSKRQVNVGSARQRPDPLHPARLVHTAPCPVYRLSTPDV